MIPCPVCNHENALEARECAVCNHVFEVSGPDPMALPEGTELQGGRYRVERYLARGGFAMTYEAWSQAFGKPVVVKELFPLDNRLFFRIPGQAAVTAGGARQEAEKLRERFRREAGFLLDLGHRHLVRVIDRFAENGTEYLVMNRIEGQPLDRWLGQCGPLPPEAAWELLQGLLDAVSYLHGEGFIHRDIKPGNVMIRDKDQQPVLIDFGLVRDVEQSTRTGSQMMFTEGYAPPEQYGGGGEPHPRQDLYALGALGYYLVTGEHPPGAMQRMGNGVRLRWPEGVEKAYRERMEWALELKAVDRPESVAAWREIAAGSDNKTSRRQQTPGGQKTRRARPCPESRFDDDKTVYICPETGLEFVEVPSGGFRMGDVWGDGDSDEKPVHWVEVPGFQLARTVVTQAMWKQVMGDNPAEVYIYRGIHRRRQAHCGGELG